MIDEFRQIHQGGYLQRNSEAIFDSHSYWNSETYKHAYAQNLDLKAVLQITATTPVIFGETFTANLNGQSYAVSKCIRESDQSFCYTVMEDGERQRLPDESIVTAPDGKKYEANVLYASNGKPLTDRQGHKSGGYGYWDEQDGWSLKLAESRMQAQDNFSRRNFEKLMTEKFGEKSPDNTLRSLIEAELEQYRQSGDYQKLAGMYTSETIAPAYAADCKTTPLTDDYVRAGDRFRAKTNDNSANLVDITDNYTKQEIISRHIDYARAVLSDKNTNQETVQSHQSPQTAAITVSLSKPTNNWNNSESSFFFKTFPRHNTQKAPQLRGFYKNAALSRLYSSVSSSTSGFVVGRDHRKVAFFAGQLVFTPAAATFFCGFLRCTALIT